MRKHFMDNLRWMVILLLIPYHAAQAFNVWGELNFICFEPSKAISSLIVFFSPFYMPLMFLLAGISTKYALEKRSYGQFVVERIKRLLIPFVFGTLFFVPIMAYIGDKTNCGYTGGFFTHYGIFFTKWTDLSGFDGGFGVGQFWFLYFLFVISIVSIGIIAIVRHISKKKPSHSMPYGLLCLFVIPLPFLYDLLTVGGKSFAEYLYVFLMGYYVLSNDEVMEKTAKYRYISLFIGVLAAVIDVYMFIWSGKDFGTANVIAKAFAEWFMMLALMGIGKRSLDFKGKISTYLSSRSILFFAIHFLWVVLFQYWFSFLTDTSIALLYFVPVVLAYIATFICCEICYHIPALCFLMGAKPTKMNQGDDGVGSLLCKPKRPTYNSDSFPGLDDYIRKNYIEEKAVFAAAGAASQAKAFMGDAMSATGDMARKAIKSTFARSAKECVPREIPEEESEVVEEENTLFEACAPAPERKLEDVVDNLEKSFMEMVFSFADQKGLSDAQVQKRANIDRKAFSKLRCGTTKNPSKSTALALTIALELNLDDAKDLLARAGYALSPCSKQDVIVKYFIERSAYDIDAVNYALYEHGEPILGTK